ncbi:MAG: hypothetical protein AAFY56_17170 [Pseudomonadota bacterium]
MHYGPPKNSILVRRGFRRPGKLRVAMRRAQGVKPNDIARECRLEERQVEAWLGEAEIGELVACCREMMGLSEEDRLKQLERAALELLEIAIEERDVRVALFLADQFGRGKNPARVLAEAVNRKVVRADRPLNEPLSRPKPAPTDPVAARQAASLANFVRPYGHAISDARRQLSDELVRAFPSKAEPATTPKPSQQSAALPAIFQTMRQQAPTLPTLLSHAATAPVALLSTKPRDGPNS